MPDACSALGQCPNLDGRLVLQRTIYGPQFALASQGSVLGAPANSAGVRPYADLTLGMTWRQVGLCQAPPASVMGLAPGEVVTVGIRTKSSRTFTDLVSDAAESSQTVSHSDRFVTQQGTQPAPQPSGGGSGGGGGGLGDIGSTAVSLAPLIIGLFASIWDDALSVGEAAVGAVGGAAGDVAGAAAGAISGLIDNGITGGGGGSSAVVQTSAMTRDILDEISRSESQSHLHQTTVTTSEESEQTIKRTFGNPYLDRSLQLRFIPVFNQFEISVELLRVTPGFVTHFLEPSASVDQRTLGSLSGGMQLRLLAAQQAPSLRPVASALHVTDQAGADDSLRRPMLDVLRTVGARSNNPAALEHGLSWSQTEARGNGIHVPIASVDNVISAWKLKGQAASRLKASLGSISADRLGAIFQRLTQTVSVYAGTHVEAVPGSCVLPDIPDEIRVIVPGATQYAAKRSEA